MNYPPPTLTYVRLEVGVLRGVLIKRLSKIIIIVFTDKEVSNKIDSNRHIISLIFSILIKYYIKKLPRKTLLPCLFFGVYSVSLWNLDKKHQDVEDDYCIFRYRYDIIYYENPGNDPCTTKVVVNRRGY